MSQVRKGRQWVIAQGDYESEAQFRDAVAQELAGLENLGHRTGGSYVVTPVRTPAGEPHFVGVGEYEVVAWVFSQQFAPAVQREEPEEVQEELVAVGAPDDNGDGS